MSTVSGNLPDEASLVQVLESLGRVGGVPCYLSPLNLVWGDQGPDETLARFRTLARDLDGRPEVWSALIRAANWRFTLVGCVCALVDGADRFCADLAYRFQ